MALVNADHDTPSTAWVSIRTALALTSIAGLGALALRLFDIASAGQASLANYAVAALVPVILSAPFVLHFIQMHLQANIASSRLDALAATDDKTGMLNRRAFGLRVNARLQENTTHSGALLVIHADDLHLNRLDADYAGRDLVIAETARVLRQLRDTGHYLGHFGHGEFVLFLPQATEPEAHRMAVKIGTAVAKTDIQLEAASHSLSVSIGGALATSQSSFATLYLPASERCAAASTAGGNRALLADPHTAPLARTAQHMKVRRAA